MADLVHAGKFYVREEIAESLKLEVERLRQQWIACADRMPDEPGTYLTAWATERMNDDPYINCLFFDGEGWDCDEDASDPVLAMFITHWMPLPAPPPRLPLLRDANAIPR